MLNMPQVPRIRLAQLPTPFIPLPRLSKELGGPNIWLKRDDMTGAVEGGNKLRKLEYTLAYAIEQGCDTVITCGGLQSNHCRATAIVGARLGLKVHLVLRGESPEIADANLLLDHLAGAQIECHPVADYVANLDAILESARQAYQDKGARAHVIPTGASDGIGIWGYINAVAELQSDFKQNAIEPEHIICASGSGGTQAGLSLGAQIYGLKAKVWGVNVCDDEAYFKQKVQQDIFDWVKMTQVAGVNAVVDEINPLEIAVNVLDGYVGDGYARANEDVLNTIRHLASLEGLVLDPVYTGKAFMGMVEELQAGRFSDADDIVFIHTGGQLGLFPYREQFAQGALV
jgi:D-cysteine desulfhydrase